MDEAANKAGRCPSCGAVVRQLPRRNISEPTELEDDAERVRPSKAPTATGPEQTIADFKAVERSSSPEANWFLTGDSAESSDESSRSNEMTIELPAGGTGSASSETIASLELSSMSIVELPDEPESTPKTVAFNAEQTIQFLGGSSAIDDSMLTSHWEGAVAGSPSDPNVTIKQKETVSGTFVSSSSLIVKSRTVRPSGATSMVTMSPADAPDYELLNVIGEGGMGVVYAARQSSIARTVALKMLKGEDSKNAAQREKFISEAVVTGELDHPNIVPIYDLGANNDGALFYSMKRVKGTPWNKVLKDRTVDENLTILLRAADAVAFAHVNGVIHRDLKPENIMLGDFGEVLVMDWGLARVSPDFPNAASVSQSDAMGGTPAYMAPEMATGPIDKISIASDVYLLGAILFEIITGKPPHSGKTVMACLFSAAKNQIIETKKRGELLDIAMKAMATNPAERHASVPEFQRAVREYQAHSQSIRLVEHAQQNMAIAQERQDYELFARATYGLQEALALWNGNTRATALLDTARVDYAKLALEKGDFDLGISLLDEQREPHRETLAALQQGLNERESRKRRIKLLKGAVAALIAAVVGIVSVAFVAVRSQRDEAVSQRNRADDARKEADQNAAEAVEARNEAERGWAQADKNFEAEKEAREEAVLQRQKAIDAKDAEEYAAYVARIGLTKAKIEEGAFDRAAELLEQCPPGLRGWEWGRLNFLCNLADRSWKNPAPIDAAAFSPDGLHVATGDWDGKAADRREPAGHGDGGRGARARARRRHRGPARTHHHVVRGAFAAVVARDLRGVRRAVGPPLRPALRCVDRGAVVGRSAAPGHELRDPGDVLGLHAAATAHHGGPPTQPALHEVTVGRRVEIVTETGELLVRLATVGVRGDEPVRVAADPCGVADHLERGVDGHRDRLGLAAVEHHRARAQVERRARRVEHRFTRSDGAGVFVVERVRQPELAPAFAGAVDGVAHRVRLGDRPERLAQPHVDVRGESVDQRIDDRRCADGVEQIGPVRAEQRRQRTRHADGPKAVVRRLAGEPPGQLGQFVPSRREAIVTEVEGHDGVAVGGDHLGAGVDEVAVCAHHPVGAVEQGQRGPLRLTERRADAHELAPHATVEDGDG